MKLRARLGKLLQTISDIPPPGQLEIVEAVPVGCDAAEGQPPGVYFNADGRVATVVFAARSRPLPCSHRSRPGWPRGGR